MATYDNKVLNGEHLSYLVQLIKNADASKADASSIPTAVSALTNDSGYQTASQVQSAISSAIAGVGTFGFEIVQTLPTTDIATNKIYLVAKTTAGTDNVYTEYAYVNNNWEILGDTTVSVETLSNTEIQTIWDSVT